MTHSAHSRRRHPSRCAKLVNNGPGSTNFVHLEVASERRIWLPVGGFTECDVPAHTDARGSTGTGPDNGHAGLRRGVEWSGRTASAGAGAVTVGAAQPYGPDVTRSAGSLNDLPSLRLTSGTTCLSFPKSLRHTSLAEMSLLFARWAAVQSPRCAAGSRRPGPMSSCCPPEARLSRRGSQRRLATSQRSSEQGL